MKLMRKLLMIVVVFVAMSSVQAQSVSYWDGVSASIWTNGTGSKGMPYLIESAEHLAYLAQSVNANTTTHYDSVYFKLTTNINLRGFPWTPIGNANTKYFSGYFDGNNYSIDSLSVNITATATSFAGLFGVLNHARVHHLTLSNVNIAMQSESAGIYAGGIAALVRGNDVIQYCHVTGGSILSISGTDRKSHAGGIVGFTQITTNSININNCTNAAFVTSNYSVGGILGSLNTTQPYHDTLWITACSNTGSIVGAPTTTNLYTGGIVGWINAAKVNTQCYIDNCSNTGSVRDSVNAGLLVYTGGIVGYIQISDTGITNSNVVVRNSWNSGAIENINTASIVSVENWSCAGGIIGCAGLYGTANIDCFNLHNSGTINFIRHAALVTSSVGGIAGLVFSEKTGSNIVIHQVYNAGHITLLSPDTITKNTCAGGVVGWINAKDGNAAVNECFNTGTISNESYNTAGIIGVIREATTGTGNNTISNCLNSGTLQSARAVAGIVARIEYMGSGTHTLANCISVGTIVDNVEKAAIAVLDNTSLDLATCYYDRQITACDSGYFYAGSATALNDTVRYARQLANLQLDTSIWYMENNMYPRLRCFKDADAMIVAATPIYFYADEAADDYNTINKVNTSFGLGGKFGSYFHSSNPIVLQIINNDSAIVNPNGIDTVVITSMYGTASRTYQVIVKAKTLIQTEVCQGEDYQFLGRLIDTDSAGVFNYYGIDSIIQVTIHPSYLLENQDTLRICDNELPYTYGDSIFYVAGDYAINYQTVYGCDSIIHLHLMVNPTYIATDTLTISADQLPYTYKDSLLSAAGDYLFYYQTIAGCDSILQLTLWVDAVYNYYDTLSICDNELPYSYNDSLFTEGGDYIVYRYTDSIDTVFYLHLVVNPTYVIRDTVRIAGDELPYDYIVGGKTRTLYNAGSYEYTLTSINGCDSTIMLELEIIGAIEEFSKNNNVKIYPNPFSDYIDIEIQDNYTIVEMQVIDVFGKTIFKQKVNRKQVRIPLTDIGNGLYILQLKDKNQQVSNYKIICNKK
ncbi:MAG TPA: T9SS type A sorting domain-containing protein [Bacteroidales bacterium]|nr:T9SS type A sorting domain-containing protein [Bacteroidales bacterium]HPJ90407.1 T9SS type A sorting domain-containing protein [Bacteroidales bacterium]